MKLSKWLTPILISSLALASASVSLVGCSDPTEPEYPSPPAPQEIQEFISDRTFSLMAVAVLEQDGKYYLGSSCFGTGWIIDDSTPEIEYDYKYHVATNWHVIQGFADLYLDTPSDFTYVGMIHAYADASSATSSTGIIDSYNDYTYLKTTGYSEESDSSTFLYTPVTKQKKGIDLYEADIDFADVSEDTPLSPTIKAKLDRLNEYRSTNGYINQFVFGDDETIINKTKYIGGYPMKKTKNSFGGKWESHIVNSDLYYIESNNHIISSELGVLTVNDTSPQYNSNINMGNNWMTGGSSGSLLLTEDKEICGIYWGGWVPKKGGFEPAFSLFNTTSKNFLSKYIHN